MSDQQPIGPLESPVLWPYEALLEPLCERYPVRWIVAGSKGTNEVTVGIVEPWAGGKRTLLDVSLYVLDRNPGAAVARVERLLAVHRG